MTVAYIRISLLRARRVSSSYTEQIGCNQNVNTRKTSVGRNHVLINDELHVKLWDNYFISIWESWFQSMFNTDRQ